MAFKLTFKEILEREIVSDNVRSFFNDKKDIIETGNILYANLKLSGEDNSLYYFDSKNNKGHYNKSGKKQKNENSINGARLSSSLG